MAKLLSLSDYLSAVTGRDRLASPDRHKLVTKPTTHSMLGSLRGDDLLEKSGDMIPPGFLRAAYHEKLPVEAVSALDLLFALRECLQRVNADLVHWLGPDALSPGRMQLLMILWASPTAVRQADLVSLLKISRPSVSELVETLELDGLVERRTDARHSLRFMVSLNAAGRASAEKLLLENTSRLGVTFGSLTVDGRRDLAGLLDGVARPDRHAGTTD